MFFLLDCAVEGVVKLSCPLWMLSAILFISFRSSKPPSFTIFAHCNQHELAVEKETRASESIGIGFALLHRGRFHCPVFTQPGLFRQQPHFRGKGYSASCATLSCRKAEAALSFAGGKAVCKPAAATSLLSRAGQSEAPPRWPLKPRGCTLVSTLTWRGDPRKLPFSLGTTISQ